MSDDTCRKIDETPYATFLQSVKSSYAAKKQVVDWLNDNLRLWKYYGYQKRVKNYQKNSWYLFLNFDSMNICQQLVTLRYYTIYFIIVAK